MNSETRFNRLMKLKEKIEKYKRDAEELRGFLAKMDRLGAGFITRDGDSYRFSDNQIEIIKSYYPQMRRDAEKKLQHLEATIHNLKLTACL